MALKGYNDRVADQFTRHAIRLERLTAGQQARALKLFRSLEKELLAKLRAKDPAAGISSHYQRLRLQALLKEVQETIRLNFSLQRDEINKVLRRVAAVEGKAVEGLINAPAVIELASVAVSPELVKAATGNAIIEGAPTSKWWARQARRVQQRFEDVVRAGLVEGQTTPQIVRRVEQDVFPAQRRTIEGLVRSSIQSVTQEARKLSFEQNQDVIKAVQQRTTLDGRTSDVCKAYAGKTWSLPDYEPIGHDLPFNGGPPRHWNCRSSLVPVVKSFEELAGLKTGGRPVEDVEGFFKKRLREQGLSAEQAGDAIRKAQASMDGAVSEDLTYEQWLRTKSREFQLSVLGPTKYRLWRSGQIGLEDLVNQRGKPLTITQLERRAS